MRLDRPEDAATALAEYVRRLGGEVVPAHLDRVGTIPLDLTFGEQAPAVAAAPPGSVAEERLLQTLPGLVEDARRMVQLLRRAERAGELRIADLLTGLLHADALHELVVDQRRGDAVVGFALPELASVEATKGRAAADEQLQGLADVVRATVRAGDRAGRLSRWSLAVLCGSEDPTYPQRLVQGVRRRWHGAARPQLRTATVTIGPMGGADALAELLRELGAPQTTEVDG
jgi:GGDEF domain-containing protein